MKLCPRRKFWPFCRWKFDGPVGLRMQSYFLRCKRCGRRVIVSD